MKLRAFGKTDWQVSEIGFGAWALGGQWGAQSDSESIAALHAALDAGVNFIDTAQGYGDGRSERVIAAALKDRSEHIIVATKTPPAPGPWPPSPYCLHQERYSPKYLRENIEQRLRNLNVDCLDVLQLHTWTRAWNDDPQPLLELAKLKQEGKVRAIGVSTPEQDQNCVVDLMKSGLVDVVQVIYNLFDQEPAAQLLPVAAQTNTAIIVRVVFDEGVLTGKYNANYQFPEDDFRSRYFAGDRLERSVNRVAAIAEDLSQAKLSTAYTMPDLAIKFALQHSAVSTVITGIRNIAQAHKNAATSDLPDIPESLMIQLRRHNWHRGVWYGGK